MNPQRSDSSDRSIQVKKRKKEKHSEKKHKKKKRKHRSSSVDSDNEKKSHKKHKKNKHKRKIEKKIPTTAKVENEDIPGPSIPADIGIENSKSRAPMTKEEWEKSQSVVRRVYDETGRSRLIKGDGEIIEEIVSKKRHCEINHQATLGDGLYFENKLYKKK